MAEGQGRSSNQGVKLLYIRDYLHKHTNKEHPKSAREISEYLASKGIKADRKTIYNDILRLQMDFQEPIEYNPKKWGYYITTPQFSIPELQAMIEGAQNSNVLTQQEIDRITKKIAELANVHDRPALEVYEEKPTGYEHPLIGQLAKPEESVLKKAEIIRQAIARKKQISFRRFSYLIRDNNRDNHGKVYSRANPDCELYIASPRDVICRNGRYILKCYQSNSLSNQVEFGIEYLEDIKILSQDIIPIQTQSIFDAPIKTTPKELTPEEQELARMCKEIAACDEAELHEYAVTLQFSRLDTEMFFIKFGYDSVIVPIENRQCQATIRTTLNTDFFSWLFSNKFHFRIIAPQQAVDIYRKYMEDILYFYEHGKRPRTKVDDLISEYIAYKNKLIAEGKIK